MGDRNLEIAILIVTSVTLFLIVVILLWKWYYHSKHSMGDYHYMSDKNLFTGSKSKIAS